MGLWLPGLSVVVHYMEVLGVGEGDLGHLEACDWNIVTPPHMSSVLSHLASAQSAVSALWPPPCRTNRVIIPYPCSSRGSYFECFIIYVFLKNPTVQNDATSLSRWRTWVHADRCWSGGDLVNVWALSQKLMVIQQGSWHSALRGRMPVGFVMVVISIRMFLRQRTTA